MRREEVSIPIPEGTSSFQDCVAGRCNSLSIKVLETKVIAFPLSPTITALLLGKSSPTFSGSLFELLPLQQLITLLSQYF